MFIIIYIKIPFYIFKLYIFILYTHVFKIFIYLFYVLYRENIYIYIVYIIHIIIYKKYLFAPWESIDSPLMLWVVDVITFK